MESLYMNPIVEDIDSAGKVWAALADDSAATAKNLTNVANVLDKIAKNTQTTFEEVTNGVKDLSDTQRRVLQGTLKMVQNVSSDVATRLLNELSQGISGVVKTAQKVKASNNTTYAVTNVAIQRALRSTVIPALRKEISNLTENEFGRLAEALGDQGRSNKTNAQNRVAVGYRALVGQLKTKRAYQTLISQDQEGKKLFDQMIFAINNMRADEISGGKGSAVVNRAFEQFIKYAKEQGIGKSSNKSVGALGGRWGHQAGKALGQNVVAIKQSANVDAFLKNAFGKDKAITQGAEYKSIKEQLKATTDSLKQQGIPYELRRKGKEVQVVMFDPNTYRFSGGRVDEKQSANMTFAIGGYNTRASHLVPYNGRLMPANVVQARLNAELLNDQKVSTIASMKRKISDINEATSYKAVNKYEKVVDNPKTAKDRALREGTIRYDNFQQGLINLEKSLRPDAYGKTVQEGIETLIQYTMGRTIKEAEMGLKAIQTRYKLSDTVVQKFKQEGEWLKDVTWMSEEDRGHQRAYLRSAVKDKMYLPTRKIQNRDIMSYADGLNEKLVQTVQIDLDRMFARIEQDVKDGHLSSKDEARYKALLEGMGKDTLVMAEKQIEQLNSIRENVSVKISEQELAQLKKKHKLQTKEDIYRFLLEREGRAAQERQTVGLSRDGGIITLTGNELIKAQAGTKVNSEGFNLRNVIQSADEDFVKYVLDALGIEADKNARAITISKLNTEVSGRNLGPFVTGIINDALTNFKDQSDEEIKEKLKSSFSGNKVVNAAMEVLKTPYDLERILDQATGGKATSGEQGKFLSKILYTIATAAGHNNLILNNGELSTKDLGLSFLDKVGIRESEYAARGDTSLPTNFEFDDFYRSASRAGVKFEHISPSQLARWTMMSVGATAQDIKEKEEAQDRYNEHMKRQQQLEEHYDPEYLNKMLGDENLIVVGNRDIYKDKIGDSRLIDIMALQSSHRGDDGMIDNRDATIWGKLEELLRGKSADELSKMRIVVDLGDDMGKLRFMDMAANIGEYGSYNNKLESLLMGVTGGQSAFEKSELLTDALKSEIYAFENTGGALNANFLAKAQENSEKRRKAIQKALGESGGLAKGEKLLGRNFYGENLNVTKLSGDKNEVDNLSDIIEHSGGYVSTARAKAWVAEQSYRADENWGLGVQAVLQKLGFDRNPNNRSAYKQFKDVIRERNIKKYGNRKNNDGIKSYGDAVNFLTEALTAGTELHTVLYGGDNPLLKYGMGYALARNPYSQMVNAQFGNYLFAKKGLADNVVESNRGLNSLVMGDFDGDKLLAVLMDLEQVAKEDIEAREKQTGETDKTGRNQLDELHNAIQKVNEFNAFNYRVMSANLKPITSSDAGSTVLYAGGKAGVTTEEQRDIILQYQNRSKGQTGYLSNLAKGGRNLLENLGYGLSALLGSDSKTLVKYGQGAVVFQVLEQLEQDAISAKKLWDVALEQIKAVEGKDEKDLKALSSTERTKLLSKYLDDQMASIVNKAYSGEMDLLDLFTKTEDLGIFKDNQLDQRRSLEILTPIANKDNAREILGQLFKNSKGTLDEIAKNSGYDNWKSSDDKDFAAKFRAALNDGGFHDWALSTKAMRAIISDFNASEAGKDFLAQSRLYSGRFQEEFGPSSLLANNNMSVAAAVLKKVESLRTGLKDEGSSGGAGGSGDGTKDIVSILTEIRDLLVKQGRGELNAKFGKSYLSPTGIAHTIISSPFKESNMDMMRQVLATNLKKPLPKWTDEERATAFGFFGNVDEFEKQREYLIGSLRGTLAHAAQEKGKSKLGPKDSEMKEFTKQMKLLGFDDGRIEFEAKEAFRAAKVTAQLEQSMFKKDGKLGSEIGFSYNAGNGKQIVGKIDALYIGDDGRVYVGDYKTGKHLGAEEAVQAQMYQEIIRQVLDDFRQMKYGNEEQGAAMDKIRQKYGFSDNINHFLEEVWKQNAFSTGRQAYLMHYNEGVGRVVSVSTPADNILAKAFNNEALTKEEEAYENNALQVQTGRTVSDKKDFLNDYRTQYGRPFGTDAYINASKGVVEKETERDALVKELNNVKEKYGSDSPLYRKLSDYYENLKSEIEALSQLRNKVAEEYEWTETDKELWGKEAKKGKTPDITSYKYNKILKEAAAERNKNYKEVEAYNKQIANAEKKMLMYDKQSRTTIGQVGPYKESTQALIEHQKEEIKLLIEKRNKLFENRNFTQDETNELNKQLATMRMVNKEEVKRSNKGANNWIDMIGSGIKNTITRMFDYSGVYRALNKLSQGLQRVLDLTNQLDQATFNIQVVTGHARGEVSGLITSYRKLADQLGATTVQIANAANEWLRQGYEAQQANELITASTYLSKLGMIDAGQATEYLTSMIKGFKLEVSDAVNVVSKLTAVDMEAASSAGDIAAALQNVATTAQLAGVSLDETIAYATTIIETTQRDASSVGMALNRVLIVILGAKGE